MAGKGLSAVECAAKNIWVWRDRKQNPRLGATIVLERDEMACFPMAGHLRIDAGQVPHVFSRGGKTRLGSTPVGRYYCLKTGSCGSG